MKENKIPSVEDYLKNSHATGMAFNRKTIQEVMIEFAKIHVKAALAHALEESLWVANIEGVDYDDIADSILPAYPEELIK